MAAVSQTKPKSQKRGGGTRVIISDVLSQNLRGTVQLIKLFVKTCSPNERLSVTIVGLQSRMGYVTSRWTYNLKIPRQITKGQLQLGPK